MEKKNNVLMLMVLLFIILGLGGYIVYDKFINPNDNLQANNENIPLYDLYLIKVEVPKVNFAFIANNKLYTGKESMVKNNGTYSPLYSYSKFDDQDIEMQLIAGTDGVKRIKTCASESEATYLVILNDGTVKELSNDFSKVTAYSSLTEYKVEDITSCSGYSLDDESGKESANYKLLLKDGSTKELEIER